MAEVFKAVGQVVDTSFVAAYTVPASTTAIVRDIRVANSGTSEPTVVSVRRTAAGSGTNYYLCRDLVLGVGDSVLLGMLALEAGDDLEAMRSGDGSASLTATALELS